MERHGVKRASDRRTVGRGEGAHFCALGFALLSLWMSQGLAMAESVQSIGFSEPVETIELSAAEAGVVEEMRVKEGDKVKAGQLLGRLDTGVLDASLKMAEAKAGSEAAIKSARARLQLRKSRSQKLQQLASSQNANAEELERAQADLEIAEADLETAEEEQKASALEVLRIREGIARRTLRSPIDGVVTRVLRDIAESVDARTEHILTIVNLDRLRIVIYVPLAVALRLREANEVVVQPQGWGEELKAKVEFISPVTEPASGTVRIKLLLDNSQGRFISGTKFVVSIP